MVDSGWLERAYGLHPSTLDGFRSVQRPNPWFSTLWYASAYPDVANKTADLIGHFSTHGWREGRDPSALFSTKWYLERYPEVARENVNPLLHYVRHGRAEGRQPHPRLLPLDHSHPFIAIIVLSFNEPVSLSLTLESLALAQTAVRSTIFLIENGSAGETKDSAADLARRFRDRGLDIRYIDLPENLGFSGGNNVGIREALQDQFTHFCLLNSDVLVTDRWLDDLLDTTEPVVGPVSNAVGNEQTVPIDYSSEMELSCISAANRFSARRLGSLERRMTLTRFLGFFCTLIERSVIERVGLLDERFFPGSFEDDDYCIRIMEAGYELKIARHVYIHHFGSASFSKLEMSQRVEIGDVNRARFVEKWQRPWEDRLHLVTASLALDAQAVQPGVKGAEFTRDVLASGGLAASDLVRNLQAALLHFRRQADQSEARAIALERELADLVKPPPSREPSRKALREFRFGGPSIPISVDQARTVRSAYASFLYEAASALQAEGCVSVGVLEALQPILAGLAQRFGANLPVVVLAHHDPVHGDEKDGFVQRVKAIDACLTGRDRIYVRYDESFRSQPALFELDNEVWRLTIADNDPIADALTGAVLKAGVNVYSHSILSGIQTSSMRRALVSRSGLLVLDLHGAVPEEFRMHDDPFSAQIFNDIERESALLADVIVSVSSSMSKHIHAKHGVHSTAITCPIFTTATAPRTKFYNVRPRAIYAGGVQRWQRIPEMALLVASARSWMDFTLLSPDPDAINRELAACGLAPSTIGVEVRSATHAEVLESYEGHDFGILLREDSTVNQVACPTKLIEYLAFGLIPVLEDTRVGDFVDMGMCFVTANDVITGTLPSVEERHLMARVNYDVIAKLHSQSVEARSSIAAIMKKRVGTENTRP